jgi:hypothetical protein
LVELVPQFLRGAVNAGSIPVCQHRTRRDFEKGDTFLQGFHLMENFFTMFPAIGCMNLGSHCHAQDVDVAGAF